MAFNATARSLLPVATMTFVVGSNWIISCRAANPSDVASGAGGSPRSSTTSRGVSRRSSVIADRRSLASSTVYSDAKAHFICSRSSPSSSTSRSAVSAMVVFRMVPPPGIRSDGQPGCRRDRQLDPNPRASSYLTLDVDRAAMGFDDPFALKQSDAQSAFLGGPERLEQRPERFRFDAGPGVGDRDHHEPVHLSERNPDRAAPCPGLCPIRTDGLPRIQDHIQQHLLELLPHDQYWRHPFTCYLDGHRERLVQRLHGLGNHFLDIHWLRHTLVRRLE